MTTTTTTTTMTSTRYVRQGPAMSGRRRHVLPRKHAQVSQACNPWHFEWCGTQKAIANLYTAPFPVLSWSWSWLWNLASCELCSDSWELCWRTNTPQTPGLWVAQPATGHWPLPTLFFSIFSEDKGRAVGHPSRTSTVCGILCVRTWGCGSGDCGPRCAVWVHMYMGLVGAEQPKTGSGPIPY